MGRVRLGPIVLIALITQLLGLALNSAIVFVTHRTHGAAQWTLTNVVTLVFAVIVAIVEAAKPEPQPERGRYSRPDGTDPGYSGGYPYPSTRRRGTHVLPALLVVLLVVGAGGFAVTQVARYAVGYFSGNEPGTDWLVRPTSATNGDLKLTVVHVYYTKHFTRIEADVQNSGSTTVSLPVYGYCIFTGKGGKTLEADPHRSHWSNTIPAGVDDHSGTVVFKGKLPETVTSATFSFTQVFGPSGGALTVRGIPLRNPG
jgi:hypothetical protein